jgi:hypothetical protein
MPAHDAGLVRLPVTHLRAAAQGQGRGIAADPEQVACGQCPGIQRRVVVALYDQQHVARKVLAGHVPRRLVAPAHAADTQALALADRVVHEPLVFSEQHAVEAADLTGLCRQVAGEKVLEAAFANKAYARRILLVVGDETGGCGAAPHLGLFQVAEREQGARQILVTDGVQEVALVLVAVPALEQEAVPVAHFRASVVTRGDVIGAEFQRIV